MTSSPSALSPDDLSALAGAHAALEHPTFAARVGAVLGAPVEQGLKLLPAGWAARIRAGAEAALTRALTVAVGSLGEQPAAAGRDGLHKALVVASGAVGGYFGMPALLVELPFTTIVMLRGIADIARAAGEDVQTLETRLACLEVFALGGRAHHAADAEIGYYEVRSLLAFHFTAVTQRVAETGALEPGLPVTVNVVRAIAARFGVTVSDKAALQMVPVLGAAAGAIVNAVFMQHFQDVARAHFTVRRLERAYGADAVSAAYDALSRAEPAAPGVPTMSATAA